MHPFAGELLLQAWEQGAAEPELSRPLALLAVAMPDRDPEESGRHLTGRAQPAAAAPAGAQLRRRS